MTQELIQVRQTENGVQTVLASELYKALGAKAQFTNWVKRMMKYGFVENQDYWEILPTPNNPNTNTHLTNLLSKKKGRGGQNAKEFVFTLDCAKSIAMLQRNETGAKIRRYFIEVEKQYRQIATPKQIQELYSRLESLERKQVSYSNDWTVERFLNANGLAKLFDKTDRQRMGKQCTKEYKRQYHQAPKKVQHPSYINGQNVYPYELINKVYNSLKNK